MTPLDLAQQLATGPAADDRSRALAVGIVLRGLTDYDPADPYRQPWPLDRFSAASAARYLGLDPTPALLAASIEAAPTISAAILNRTAR